MNDIVDIDRVADATSEAFRPKDLVSANDTIVRLAKLEGEFPWHMHDEDELFLCWRGAFRIELEGEHAIDLRAGQIYVVPRGARHRPVAKDPAYTLLIERPETLQYGNTGR
ncbi:MAG TPA: cupin domain-containing protein [Candidatus Acidoferrales bacterium]|nr:cupin domain-containing protein [Candidatus Acidoferrales bacterium]